MAFGGADTSQPQARRHDGSHVWELVQIAAGMVKGPHSGQENVPKTWSPWATCRLHLVAGAAVGVLKRAASLGISKDTVGCSVVAEERDRFLFLDDLAVGIDEPEATY
jgi:hypothetical protein